MVFTPPSLDNAENIEISCVGKLADDFDWSQLASTSWSIDVRTSA